MELSIYVIVLTFICASIKCNEIKQPHIIVIIADDLGWNDVSFHGSNQIPTPNIDALAYNGIILNSHYVQPLCTPSRAAFLTGKYPIHTGMQHLVILEPEPRGLPLEEKLLPQYLQSIGYSTHAVGKWHLGFYRTEYTPTKRGFDSHYGFWNGFQDYYDHTVQATFNPTLSGYDMRRNFDIDFDARGKYSTHLFADEASRIISKHNASRPLFLYLAHVAPHTGNMRNPFQAPDEEIAKFSHIADPERRVYAAMVSVMDQSVGRVVSSLRNKGMLDNSIILFISDNGAPTHGVHSNRGSNYPLRGQKESPWEGAYRGVSAVWSPLLQSSSRVSNQLMHITDWLPTFWKAAGRDPNELGNIDGINMWEALKENTPSPRTDMVMNIDSLVPYVAVRKGEWKYINGTTLNGRYDEWYGDSGALADPYDPKTILSSPTSVSLSGYITERQIREKQKNISDAFSIELLQTNKIVSLRNEATINCDFDPKNSAKIQCNPLEAPCVFNIKDDPCEMVNLAGVRPIILSSLEEFVSKYVRSSKPPSNVPMDLNSDPAKYGNVWVSWKDDNISVRSIFNSLSNTVIIAFGVFCAVACLSILTVLCVTMKRMKCFGGVRPGNSRSSRLPRSLDREKRRSHNREPVIVPPVSVAQRVEMFEEREHSI